MRFRAFFIACIVLFGTGSAAAATQLVPLGSGCSEQYIVNDPGDSDGAIVKTDDGHIYEVDEVDRVDSELWLGSDDVLVCWERFRYKGKVVTFYTLRDGDDKADATRLR